MEQRRSEQITAVVLELFALVYAGGSLTLKVGQVSNPGAGLMPLAVGALFVVCATIHLVRVFRQPPRAGAGVRDASALVGDASDAPPILDRVALGIAAAVLVYPFLLAYLNFLLSSFLLLSVILVVLDRRRLHVSALTSALMTILTFVLFARLLGVVLPSGPLEQLVLAW